MGRGKRDGGRGKKKGNRDLKERELEREFCSWEEQGKMGRERNRKELKFVVSRYQFPMRDVIMFYKHV